MSETNTLPETETVESAVETVETAAAKTVAATKAAAEERVEAIESAEDRLIDAVTATQQEALETIESTREAVIEMMSRAQAEISSFVAERIRQDLDVQQALLRCRNLDELRDVQVRFVRTAMDQYGDQAMQMVRIGGEVATRSLERARA